MKKRSYNTLGETFQQDMDGSLRMILETAPGRRWPRLEELAEDGHAGAAAIVGSRSLDEALGTSGLMKFFNVDTHYYRKAYENLSRYQLAGGKVDVSADIARAAENLSAEEKVALDARVRQWGTQYASTAPVVKEPLSADNSVGQKRGAMTPPPATDDEQAPKKQPADTAPAPAVSAPAPVEAAPETPHEVNQAATPAAPAAPDVAPKAGPEAVQPEAPVIQQPVQAAPAPVASTPVTVAPAPVTAPPAAPAVPNNAVSAVAPVLQHNDIAYTPANAVAASPPPDYTEYDVKKGDSLWKIAKEHYGLTDDKAIQDAVDKIAFTNGKGQGTDANRIHPGETLRIPDSPVKGENDSTLNWKALDAEVKAGTVFRQHFGDAAGYMQVPDPAQQAQIPVPVSRAEALVL